MISIKHKTCLHDKIAYLFCSSLAFITYYMLLIIYFKMLTLKSQLHWLKEYIIKNNLIGIYKLANDVRTLSTNSSVKIGEH